MNGLSWAAFACYVGGAALAVPGLIYAYLEARTIGRAIRDYEAVGPADDPSKGLSYGQIPKAGALAVALAGDSTGRWRAFWLLLSGLLVELAGNMLSLPW